MIVLSLNVRGIGGLLKKASFRKLLVDTKPNIILLQETLSPDHISRDFVHSLRSSWFSAAASSIGNSGGLLAAWDPVIFDLVPYITCGGILLMGRCLATDQEIAFLNVYGPCLDRLQFWSRLAASGILSIPNLILGGDLNITLTADELWGGITAPASGGVFYINLFSSFNLFDILPNCIVPTWRNGRSGVEAIARRLDRFLISGNYLTSAAFPTSWVEYPYFSNHAPILLKLNRPLQPIAYPFKFNHHWLSSANYSDLVHSIWTDPRFLLECNP
jgi:hypothetical protein